MQSPIQSLLPESVLGVDLQVLALVRLRIKLAKGVRS